MPTITENNKTTSSVTKSENRTPARSGVGRGKPGHMTMRSGSKHDDEVRVQTGRSRWHVERTRTNGRMNKRTKKRTKPLFSARTNERSLFSPLERTNEAYFLRSVWEDCALQATATLLLLSESQWLGWSIFPTLSRATRRRGAVPSI